MNDRYVSPAECASSNRKLVLASTSLYRKQLLDRLGLACIVSDPRVDETVFKQRGSSPRDLTLALAEAKASAVAAKYSRDAIVIGCDQCVSIDDQILGKPGSVDRAFEQLRMLSGRIHTLVTALCVIDTVSQHRATEIDVHELTMRVLSDDQIRVYVDVDRPLDCAGSYKFESLGIALFERASEGDTTAIVGLPIMRLTSMLADVGYDVLSEVAAYRQLG